jgi:carbonic anhydrase/acetyltransferase-like protein (isoleucine patch superfamily)
MAVIRGDVHTITIGQRTSVQDGCVLHVTHDGPYSRGGQPLAVGNDVTIGHRAVLHGCRIGNRCLIGMGAVILDGVEVEDDVLLAAGSVVPPGKRLTSGTLWRGNPLQRARDLTSTEIAMLKYSAEHYVRIKEQHRLAADASGAGMAP